MTAVSTTVEELKRARPEWTPWLRVLEAVGRESSAPAWERMLPASLAPDAGVPLLAGASIPLQASAVRRLLDRLIELAALGGTEAMRSLRSVRATDDECAALFAASLRHDTGPVVRLAEAHAADAEALQAVIALLAVPFLQTCNRRMAGPGTANSTRGCCPLCGSWPAFAEVRGIERSRHFRCARCGTEWHARALACPFCGMNDHEQLAALVPGQGDAHAVIDACNACRGYVKAFTRLQGCQPEAVMIEDLASVDLDMAALDNGYERPPGGGCLLDIDIAPARGARRFLDWLS